MKRSLAILILLTLALGLDLQAQMTVYVVRHAEKDETTKTQDPSLSEAGQTRARDLARTLKDAGVDRCLATQYKRTQETLQVLAKNLGQEVQGYAAGKEKDLAKTVLTDMKGKTLAIAGHSNTVPAILAALGVSDPPKLEESDYDNLFVVNIDAEGKSKILRLHYGAANPK